MKRNHRVEVFEPLNGWSFNNWIQEKGVQGVKEFEKAYPHLHTNFYDNLTNFDTHLNDADLVIVHEWNDPNLVEKLGGLKEKHGYTLLFHDTHHRSVTAPEEIHKYDLSSYDGVLAFGKVIRDLYLENNWAKKAWTWHEAADTSMFKPIEDTKNKGDLVWIGNWGDDERTEELIEFLIEPVKELGLKAKMYGVRYPQEALELLRNAGIEYGGYLPSYEVPKVYSQYRCTVHIPRRVYAKSLPGIPTIRPFEVLACGIPLVSAPWQDTEDLFRVGSDFIMVQDGRQMIQTLNEVLISSDNAGSLINHGLETIQNNHTCAHRVDQLLEIYNMLSMDVKDDNIKFKAS